MTNSRNLQRSKISPCQVAIHVQRYLILNNFTNSASHFRQEAGTLIAEAIAKKEVPSSVLCLGQMLDEYALLKEQKVFLDQEWATLMQEKINFEMMVQHFMSKYSISQMSQAPMMITNCARVPQPCKITPSGVSIVATGLSPTMDSTVAATYNVDPTPALIPIEEVAVNPTQKIGQGDYCTSPVTGEPCMVDPANGVLDSFTSDFDKEVDISNPNYLDSGMEVKSLLDVFESEFEKDVDISSLSYLESDMKMDLDDLEFV